MPYRLTVAVALLILFSNLGKVTADEKTYSTKYDNVDLDEILANERLLNGYIKCLMNEGPCTADGKELKDNLPDAVNNDCSKCSEKQKNGSDKVTHFMIDNKPEQWDKLEKMYNPSGDFKRKYLEKKEKDEESSTEEKQKA